MEVEQVKPAEETLDPQDWESMRAMGHQMWDDMLTYLQTVRDRPIWQPIPDSVREMLNQPLPESPGDLTDVYDEFKENILPHPMGNIHPRFWGWVIGTGSPSGVLAEMLAATMNPNMGGGNHVPNEVEKQVIRWLAEIMGFPLDSSGLLVSGGSMANLVGITVARNQRAGYNLREQGVAASPRKMVMYGSVETHGSVQKAAELLGLGNEAYRKIPVNSEYQIDLDALKKAIAEDKAAGHHPFCIVGNAGTVNTGAFDDLNALADICQREGMWFHVDGAFGSMVRLSPESAHLADGLERGDSVAFDLHKWLYMPYEIGCCLVKSEEAHRRTFSLSPDYLVHMPRGLAGGSAWFSEYGIQLSRGFRALKAWMLLKEHGTAKYGRLIQQNIEQTQYLADLVNTAPELELCAPTPLNITCFRFVVAGKDTVELNTLNQEILMRLHEQGIAAPSYTMLGDRWVIRVANTNHRSRREDFDLLVREVIRIGKEVLNNT